MDFHINQCVLCFFCVVIYGVLNGVSLAQAAGVLPGETAFHGRTSHAVRNPQETSSHRVSPARRLTLTPQSADDTSSRTELHREDTNFTLSHPLLIDREVLSQPLRNRRVIPPPLRNRSVTSGAHSDKRDRPRIHKDLRHSRLKKRDLATTTDHWNTAKTTSGTSHDKSSAVYSSPITESGYLSEVNQLMEHLEKKRQACEEKGREFYRQNQDAGQVYCNSTFDRVLCWPTTLAGQTAIQPCPEIFAGVKYLNIGNASKECYANGSWELKTDYNQCHPEFGVSTSNIHNSVVRWLYYVGFTLSIVSCVIALFIFLYFRSLQCVRNKIHCHLIVTFVLRNLIWLIMNNTFPLIIVDNNETFHLICRLVVAMFNYAQVTNFFWMLVEGLYLHLMIVWAFSIERIRFWWYIILGWCIPAVIVLIWSLVKLHYDDNTCWLPEAESKSSDYEYIYIVPVLLVLLINVIFLITIVVVLITKLRASNEMLARQYKKAVRATVILLPLLGLTYILFIVSPGEERLVENLIFIYFNTILQSTQGLAVTLFYCFLNGEVRATIRGRWQRWREGRSISTRYTPASMATNGDTNIEHRVSFKQSNGLLNGPSSEAHVHFGATTNNKNNNQVDDVLIHKQPDIELQTVRVPEVQSDEETMIQ